MEFVKTQASDGLWLQGIFNEPGKKKETAILHIHGMSGNFWENSFVQTMIAEYPKNGVAFLSGELRGAELIRFFKAKEGWKRIGNAYEIFEESVYDIQGWIDFLKKRGYQRIYLQGHSLGCSKIAYFTCFNAQDVAGLILISPSDMLGLILNQKDTEKRKKHLTEARKLVQEGRGEQLLTDTLWDFYMLSAKTYLNFFEEKSNAAIFNYYKPALGFKMLNRIKVPALSFFGTKDDGIITDPDQSTDILKRELKNCKKFKGVVLENAEHSFDGFEMEIVNNVLEFIAR